MPDKRRPDIVSYPSNLILGKFNDKVFAAHRRFGPVVGVPEGKRGFIIAGQAGRNHHYIRDFDPENPPMLVYPPDDPRAGDSRYEWEPADPSKPDGIKYGYLIQEAPDGEDA